MHTLFKRRIYHSLGEILAETDLPEGAFSILPCSRDGADLFTTDERLKLLSFTGSAAANRARSFARAALARTAAALAAADAPPLTETSVEVIGAEDQFGDFSREPDPREVVLKIAARHPAAAGVTALIKAVTGLALATPAGLAIFLVVLAVNLLGDRLRDRLDVRGGRE